MIEDPTLESIPVWIPFIYLFVRILGLPNINIRIANFPPFFRSIVYRILEQNFSFRWTSEKIRWKFFKRISGFKFSGRLTTLQHIKKKLKVIPELAIRYVTYPIYYINYKRFSRILFLSSRHFSEIFFTIILLITSGSYKFMIFSIISISDII